MRSPCEALRIPGLYLAGSTWNDNIYSQASFARGNGLTVQFKLWYKAGVNVQSCIMADGTIIIPGVSIIS